MGFVLFRGHLPSPRGWSLQKAARIATLSLRVGGVTYVKNKEQPILLLQGFHRCLSAHCTGVSPLFVTAVWRVGLAELHLTAEFDLTAGGGIHGRRLNCGFGSEEIGATGVRGICIRADGEVGLAISI